MVWSEGGWLPVLHAPVCVLLFDLSWVEISNINGIITILCTLETLQITRKEEDWL